MNARLGQHLTLLGICSMVFYGVMLGMGQMSVDLLPQFVISAIIFLSSGRVIKRAAVRTSEESDGRQKEKAPSRPEPDWPWLTGFLNWMAAFLIISSMALLLMKPSGITLQEALSHTEADEHFYGSAVP